MKKRIYFLTTSLCACCCLLFSDQLFGGDRLDSAAPQVPTTKGVNSQATNPSNELVLKPLADFICRQPIAIDIISNPNAIRVFTLLGLKINHGLRWRSADHNKWGLGIPGEYCTEDGQLRKDARRPMLILTHKPYEEEASFYLVDLYGNGPDGKKPKVVHNDSKTPRGLVNFNNPKIASDFELTKDSWLTTVQNENSKRDQ